MCIAAHSNHITPTFFSFVLFMLLKSVFTLAVDKSNENTLGNKVSRAISCISRPFVQLQLSLHALCVFCAQQM